MKVLIQKKNGEFLNVSCYEAWDGFYKTGFEIEFFEGLEELLLKLVDARPDETIVHGSVYMVREALKRFGYEPFVQDYPSELREFLGRNIAMMKMNEFMVLVNSDEFETPRFVKPVLHKQFVGKVVRSFADIIQLAGIPDDSEVWVSDVVDFYTEWRVFVLREQVVGIKHYKGNAWALPSKFEIERMIGAFKNAPAAYSLDVGVVARDSGGSSTLLVEINDSFALGAYGLPSIKYCQMIAARWKELVCQN